MPYEANNRMGWLDVTNPAGGLCMADKSLVTEGNHRRRQLLPVLRPEQPGRRLPDSLCSSRRICLAAVWRRQDRDSRRVRHFLGFGGAVARLMARQISIPTSAAADYKQSAGQTTALQTTDTLFPPIVQGPAVPADNTFIAVIISEQSTKSLCSAMVSFGAAPAWLKHYA